MLDAHISKRVSEYVSCGSVKLVIMIVICSVSGFNLYKLTQVLYVADEVLTGLGRTGK